MIGHAEPVNVSFCVLAREICMVGVMTMVSIWGAAEATSEDTMHVSAPWAHKHESNCMFSGAPPLPINA